MNHALTLHSDGTLAITLPKDAEVNRVVVDGVEYNLQPTCNQLATDCISRQQAIDDLHKNLIYRMGTDSNKKRLDDWINSLPSAEPDIIRCKDCKHKPHTSDKYDYDNGDCGFEIIFPDYRCPCRCDDEYYNRIPDDDWYCANAERRTDE